MNLSNTPSTDWKYIHCSAFYSRYWHGMRPVMSDRATFLLDTNNEDMQCGPNTYLWLNETIFAGSPSKIPNNTSTKPWSQISHLLFFPSITILFPFFVLFSSILLTILCATQCANASTSSDIDIMNDSTSGTLGVRKRVDSTTDDQIINLRKRPRVSSMAGPFSLNDPISIGVGVSPVKFSKSDHTFTSHPFLCSDWPTA